MPCGEQNACHEERNAQTELPAAPAGFCHRFRAVRSRIRVRNGTNTEKVARSGPFEQKVPDFRPVQPPATVNANVVAQAVPPMHREFVVGGVKNLAPRAGFEPATIRLTVECSTAE